jgi:hypothetical protein
MESDHILLIISIGLSSFLGSVYYVDQQIKKVLDQHTNNKIVDEILHTKILTLEKDIEKLQKFKMKVMERNVVVRENRAWDTSSSSDDDDEFDEEEEEDEVD